MRSRPDAPYVRTSRQLALRLEPPYGETFVAQRRVVEQEFRPAAVTRLHRPVIVREVAALRGRLLATPDVSGLATVDYFRQRVSCPRVVYTRAHAPLQLDGRDVWPPSHVGPGPLHPDRRNCPQACGSRPGFAFCPLRSSAITTPILCSRAC